MLQDAISSVDDYEFEIENALARQLGAKPLPFPGMDSEHYCLVGSIIAHVVHPFILFQRTKHPFVNSS